uniref:Uncharacterized protein n=1 Tax=Xiphophorus couchianus TaxID=32473 RepID=A0A3B5KU71_9TELE
PNCKDYSDETNCGESYGLCISYLLLCSPAVDCIMSPWTAWSGCSVTCGLGSLFRQRDILRDALRLLDTVFLLPVHGHWSAWTEWSECDALCGGGVRQRSRTCSAPPPKNGGRECEGMTRQSQTCNIQPLHGGWSLWSRWSPCSSDCDSGVQTRERLCSSPTPQHRGSNCSGPHIQTKDCNSHPCSVDGAWSRWSDWTDCSKSCGGGIQSRRRLCDSPSPEGAGNYCEGLGTEVRACNTDHCPVHGSWSSWSAWSECDECAGSSIRTRQCNSPPARFGGLPCLGESRQSRRCHDNSTVCSGQPTERFHSDCNCSVPGCHVDGGWGQWGAWTECSLPCGGGVTFRRRLCDNPAPQAGGRGCLGAAEQKKDCNMQMCTGSRLIQASISKFILPSV